MYGVCACVVYERIYVNFVCICKPTGHTVWPEKEIYESHFRTFCELVVGEENKLTTFSTWTIMLGCNESNMVTVHM